MSIPLASATEPKRQWQRDTGTTPPFLSDMSLRAITFVQDFGGEDPSYLSREDFDKLRSGEEEDSLEVGLKSWCVVKLE